MKKLYSILLCLLALSAGAQTIISTNLLNLTYVSGTNNGNVYWETNVSIPAQRLMLQHIGITNVPTAGILTNALLYRLQLSIDGSNTNWVTLETFYPSTTNATVDDEISTVRKISLPLRIQVVTTNTIGVSVFRQRTL